MANNYEILLAFVIVPVYLGVTYVLSHNPRLRRLPVPAAFALNWGLAAAGLGTYSALTGLGAGHWIGVAICSGMLAAGIATALASWFGPKRA